MPVNQCSFCLVFASWKHGGLDGLPSLSAADLRTALRELCGKAIIQIFASFRICKQLDKYCSLHTRAISFKCTKIRQLICVVCTCVSGNGCLLILFGLSMGIFNNQIDPGNFI